MKVLIKWGICIQGISRFPITPIELVTNCIALDLNSTCSVFRSWGFVRSLNGQMLGTMAVRYSEHHLVNGLLFRPLFEYWSAIQMPGTMVMGIGIANHFNNKHV